MGLIPNLDKTEKGQGHLPGPRTKEMCSNGGTTYLFNRCNIKK